MNYNYTQLHEIIETQYKVNYDKKNNNKNWWFLNESAKLFKGYTNPSTYLNTIISGNDNTGITIHEDPPIYIDN